MLGYGLIFLAAVLWGLIGLFSKGVLLTGVGALEIAFWRALFGGGLFLIQAGVTSDLTLQRWRDLPAFGGFALLGVSVFYASLNLAIERGGVSLAWILLYTAPAFVVAASWLLLGERLTQRKVGLTGLTLLGIILVSISGGEGIDPSASALFWGLLAGFSYASYYIFGKWMLDRYSPVALNAFVMPLGALGLLPLVTFETKTLEAWGLLVLLSVVSTYLAYLLYYRGLKRVEASRAVLVATIEPVVAAGTAALVFGERYGAWGLAGAALVLSASVVAALPERRARVAPPA